jgi:hypothetical protein
MDVWKGILSHNGGLEMGSEHYYYVGPSSVVASGEL